MNYEQQKQQYLASELAERRYVDIINLLDLADLRFLLEKLQTSDFFTAPASTQYHLKEIGGLTQHILDVYRQLTNAGPCFNESKAAKIALLHDFCKINLYIPNMLKSGAVSTAKPWVVRDSLPLGHGEKSIIRALQWGVELTDEEMFLIRWHMGEDDYFYQYRQMRTYFKKELQINLYILQQADRIATLYEQLEESQGVEKDV